MAHPQMLRGVRLINAIILGTTDGAQLQTLLADGGRAAAFNAVLQRPGQMIRMAASSTAMNAVAASSTAMNAVAASSTAMNAVIASSTAMNAVAASSTAMAVVDANDQAVRIWMLAGTGQNYASFASVAAVAASSTAMTAVIASSTAMAAVVASSTAMNAVAASSTAMNAVAASSAAMAAVIASNTAMAVVAASSTAMAAISAVSSARSAFINSTKFTVAGVPAMTGATTPSGLITTNDPQGVMGSYACIKALDKNASSYWQASGGVGIWVGYEFATERIITRLEKTEQVPASYGTATGRLQAFSGGSWVDCVSFTGNISQPAFSSYTVTNLVRSKQWRFINDATIGGYINIKALDFVGFDMGV